MSFSGLTSKRHDINTKIEYMNAVASKAVKKYIETDQGKLALELADNTEVLDKITNTAVEAVLDPIEDYRGTLRAMHLRESEIRRLTHNLYLAYINANLPENENESAYEEIMLPEVAQYVLEHQEIYNSINVEALRQ